MTQRFLIAGMPRCRTAWFSVVMSTVNSICYHEPTSRLPSFEGLVELWKPKYGERVGVSDSALTLQLDRILETVAPRTLIIDRPIPQVMASFQRYLEKSPMVFDYDLGRAYLGQIQSEMEKFRSHPLVRTVEFDALDDFDATQEIINWLAPGIEILDLRQMMHMNIQVDLGYALSLLDSPHTHWHRDKCKTSASSEKA